ncbi:MAG TPA: cytochrome o ubiquinol oxidase subunit IV [Candidatus Saccharimonadales bacterium]|nr:cytochrome o ubiquinol oxidase subunit IV [Candidatus Saccharimonadales bacterium]
MNQLKPEVKSTSRQPEHHGSVQTYTAGFIFSIALTVVAYLLVSQGVYSGWNLVYAILGLAIIQLFVQMIFFLHLGSGPSRKWNLTTFGLMITIVLIVVVGSVWIMHNLNYRMTPQQMNKYMIEQDGGI